MTDKEFQNHILQLLHAIPAGKSTSYGRLAALAGHPRHARMVGRIMKNLPSDGSLPWFRVATSNGQLAFPEGTEAYQRQRALLEAEGVVFKNGKVPLKPYLWHP